MSTINENLTIKGRVCWALTDHQTGETQTWESPNIITTAGVTHYRQLISPNDAETNAFQGANGRMQLAKSSTTPAVGDTFATPASKITASIKAYSSGYPRLNCPDTDNSGRGAGVLTYKCEWATTDFNDTGITAVFIHLSGATGTDPILMHSLISSFDKSSSQTLKVFVNHTLS